MGWASGSNLMSNIIENLNETDIDDDTRQKIYEVLINAFEEYDCDTLSECVGEDTAFDSVYHEMYPPENESGWEED